LPSSSLVHPVIGASPSSELDQNLGGFPFVHSAVSIGHVLQTHDLIEDPARLDRAVEDVRQQLLNVRSGRSGAAGDGDVVEEGRQRFRDRLFLGKTDAANRATQTGDAERRARRLFEADALERGNLNGVSEGVLEALARALQLDEAERAHLFDLALRRRRRRRASARRSNRCGQTCSASSTR
jgi:hypothetical protein